MTHVSKRIGLMMILAGLLSACTITHEHVVQAPAEPIRVELAIKIDQEVRVRLEEDVRNIINENPNLF